MKKDKIDFVITWVNDKDKNWQKVRRKYISKFAKNADISEERYRDYGTLKFLIRGIDKFAPWVNKVWLVTDKQVPEWLNTNSKIKVVDHTEIIEEKSLPTFNSNAIEWNIYKIPSLAENFVYFNDDTLLNAPVEPEDFFENNLPKDFKIYNSKIPRQAFDKIIFNNLLLMNSEFKQSNKHKLLNIKYGWQQIRTFLCLPQVFKGIPGYLDPHGPLALKKSSFEKVYKLWSKDITETVKHKFREYDDISIWLVRYFQLERGNFKPRKVNFNRYYDLNDIDKIIRDLIEEKSSTICINDAKVENFDEKSQKLVLALEKKFKNKSKFEI